MLWMGIWVHPYTVTPVRVGVDFSKFGAWLRLSDVVVSWLRFQTPKDCIPQPWHIYAKCFSRLRCCGWAYGYTYAELHVLLRVYFRNNGVWPNLYDVAV